MAIQFLYSNLGDTTSALVTSTSQETNFPDDNVILKDRNNPWRTPTSGGYFNISAGTQNLHFRESDNTSRTAVMSISVYSVGSLRTEIETQMEAVATDNYNVTFTSNFTWQIQRDPAGSLTLVFVGNTATSIGREIGYSTTANPSTTTGTLTAQDRAIHSYEFIQFDLGAASTVSAVAIIDKVSGIQIQQSANSGTTRWQGSDTEAFSSLTIDQTLSINNGIYASRLTGGAGTIPSARYWRALVTNPRNTDGYVQLGYISFGNPFEPTSTDVSPDFEFSIIDRSPESQALGGQKYYDKRDKLKQITIELPLMSNADRDQLQTIFSITGITDPFFIFVDPALGISSNLSEYTLFGRFTEELTFQYRISDLYDMGFTFQEAI